MIFTRLPKLSGAAAPAVPWGRETIVVHDVSRFAAYGRLTAPLSLKTVLRGEERYNVHGFDETVRPGDALVVRALRGAGARIESDQPFEVAVGRSIAFKDPSGIVHHLLQQNGARPVFAEPAVYNSCFETPVADIAGTRALLENGLGFKAMTERYFPPSVPYLEAAGGIAFMLHHHQPGDPDFLPREGGRADDLGAAQVFAATALGKAGSFSYGRGQAFATPGGAPFEIWQWG